MMQHAAFFSCKTVGFVDIFNVKRRTCKGSISCVLFLLKFDRSYDLNLRQKRMRILIMFWR